MSELLDSTSASATAAPSGFSTAVTAATTGEEDDTACGAVEDGEEAGDEVGRERGEGGGEEERAAEAAAAAATLGLLLLLAAARAPRPSLPFPAAPATWRGAEISARIGVAREGTRGERVRARAAKGRGRCERAMPNS